MARVTQSPTAPLKPAALRPPSSKRKRLIAKSNNTGNPQQPIIQTKGNLRAPAGHEFSGGERRAVPAHHNLDDYIEAYIRAAALKSDPKAFLFRILTDRPMSQVDVYRMIWRRAVNAGITAKIRLP
jgi:hypothetical protein